MSEGRVSRMPEYITKERALEAFVRAMDFTDFEWDRVCEEMDFIPPDDVAPVVHARWRYVGSNWECSNCLFPVYSKSKFYRYCLQCGARMDGGE